MPKCKVVCTYCGHIESVWVYAGYDGDYKERCRRCGDANTDVEELDEGKKDVFGYNWELKRKNQYGKE